MYRAFLCYFFFFKKWSCETVFKGYLRQQEQHALSAQKSCTVNEQIIPY